MTGLSFIFFLINSSSAILQFFGNLVNLYYVIGLSGVGVLVISYALMIEGRKYGKKRLYQSGGILFLTSILSIISSRLFWYIMIYQGGNLVSNIMINGLLQLFYLFLFLIGSTLLVFAGERKSYILIVYFLGAWILSQIYGMVIGNMNPVSINTIVYYSMIYSTFILFFTLIFPYLLFKNKDNYFSVPRDMSKVSLYPDADIEPKLT